MAMRAAKTNAKSGYWGRRRVINRRALDIRALESIMFEEA
jgi:hypothetical protein